MPIWALIFAAQGWALAIRVKKRKSIIMCWAILPKPMPIGWPNFLTALCDHAPLLAKGEDATYQTRVVEAMHGETEEQEDENGI